jgi:hypothetical protein
VDKKKKILAIKLDSDLEVTLAMLVRVRKQFGETINKSDLARKAIKKYIEEEYPVEWKEIQRVIEVARKEADIAIKAQFRILNDEFLNEFADMV